MTPGNISRNSPPATFVVIAIAILTAGAVPARSVIAGERRVAPLVVGGVRPSGLVIGEPRIVDRMEEVPVIESFVFKVEKAPPELKAIEASVNLISARGLSTRHTVRLTELRSGQEITVPVNLNITEELEGLSSVVLRVTQGKNRLFFGDYDFGYPRYHSSRKPRRVSTSTTIRDDFESDAIDESRWRVWRSDPEKFRTEQREGRYWIHLKGETGYNGLVSRLTMETRDVVAVCRTGIESPSYSLHRSLVHLCGSGLWSPDHWFEVSIRDGRQRGALAASAVALPLAYTDPYRGRYRLPHPAKDGYLVKIECEASGNQCRGFVLVDREWWQIGEAFEVPARRTRLEIKSSGFGAAEDHSSTSWFDDCRVYPRPGTHYVTFVLRRPDGKGPGARTGQSELVTCFGPDNARIHHCDFQVKLYTSDGATKIGETDTSEGFGYALFKLDKAPWELFPVSAMIRVFANGRQIGPDHVIESHGVEGMYPDDVYSITLD